MAEQTWQTDNDPSIPPFPIVGIGAFTGGLEQFNDLLSYLPDDTRIALVLIQHLSANDLTSLLQMWTREKNLSMQQVSKQATIKPNYLYTVPPETKMTSRDVDTLQQEAEEVKASYHYAKVIVETTREPLMVLDEDLRVYFANRAFYDFFQVSPAEVEGKLFWDLGDGKWDDQGLRSRLRNILRHHTEFEDFRVEHIFERIGFKVILLNAREMNVSENKRMILVGLENITQRDEAEQQLTRLLEEAKTANANKDYFISFLSHELRTPLSAVQGWTQLLLSGKCDEKTTKRALESIKRNVRIQSHLIDDLLDISRMMRGNLHLEFLSVSLSPLIEATIDTIESSAQQKNIQLELKLDPCPQRISADPDRIQQILWNLLTNAIKFTPEGGKVTVCLTSTPAYVQVQVMDTGCGISPDFLPYLFEPFHQASNHEKQKKGLGLGLAIVRELVKRHKGNLWAESLGEGQGATFTVQFPSISASEQANTQN